MWPGRRPASRDDPGILKMRMCQQVAAVRGGQGGRRWRRWDEIRFYYLNSPTKMVWGAVISKVCPP